MKLYEIIDNIKMLENEDFDEQTMKDTLDSLQISLSDKLENMAKLIKNIDSECEMIRNEENRLAEKRRTLERKIEGIKSYAESCLASLPDKKIKTGIFSLALQKNAPSLYIENESFIPEKFWIEQLPKLDKKLLIDEVKKGLSIQGVELKQTESLRIR